MTPSLLGSRLATTVAALAVVALPWVAICAGATVRPRVTAASEVVPVFSTPVMADALRTCGNSLVVAAMAAFTALALGIVAGCGLAARPRTARVATACLPLLVPAYALALGWDALVWLTPPGWGDFVGNSMLHTRAGAGATLGTWGSTIVVLTFLGTHRRRDPERIEAARLLGGARGNAQLAIADHAPGMLAATAAVFALALVEPTVPYLFRLSNPALDVHAGALMNYVSSRGDALAALVAALPLAVPAVAVWCAVVLLRNRRWAPVTLSARRAATPTGARAWHLSLALGLILLPPILGLGLAAGRGGRGTWVTIADLAPIAGASLWGALAATALAALPALVLAQALLRARGAWRLTLVALLVAPLAIPGGIAGLGLARLLNRPGLDFIYTGRSIVCVAQALAVLPVVTLLAWAALARVPARLEEEARALGAGAIGTLLRARLAEARPGLALAAGAGALLAFAELPATSVVLPAGVETLPYRILQLAHYGSNFDLAIGALFVVAVATLGAVATAAGALLLQGSGSRNARLPGD